MDGRESGLRDGLAEGRSVISHVVTFLDGAIVDRAFGLAVGCVVVTAVGGALGLVLGLAFKFLVG